MTMMALAKTPSVWAAGVEEFGIINWFTMLQHEDALLQQYEKSLLGDPVKDRKIYEADSPITYIHDVRSPLLVLQGENDPRVPKEQAKQVVNELKKDGKTARPSTRIIMHRRVMDSRNGRIASMRSNAQWPGSIGI